MTTNPVPAGYFVRTATADDLPALVALLADDALGATRERPDELAPYQAAFADIEGDPHQHLVVLCATGRPERPLGTLQLTLTPGLSHRGATRATIEAVRVAAEARGAGLGGALVSWAIAQAAARGCALVQLTSDASRGRVHRFYKRLGFTASHVGFKLRLP